MKIYLPLDSAAVALGADEIAEAIDHHAQGLNCYPSSQWQPRDGVA